jgi:DNA polymerase III epsilon subunit-like protein
MNQIDQFLSQVLILDTECTHAQPDQAQIVELAVATYDVTKQDWKIQSDLFNAHMPPAASAVTGISNRMLADLDTFGSDAEQVLDMLDINLPMWVAHNVQYDRTVIKNNLQNTIPELVQVIDQEITWLCTLRLARHTWCNSESFQQNYLRYWLDLPVPDHVGVHRAGADVITCGELLKRICEDLIDANRLDVSLPLAPQLIELCASAIPITTWPFGKHKGKRIKDLDTDYLLWCVDNMNALNHKDPDLDLDLYESVRQELESRLTV